MKSKFTLALAAAFFAPAYAAPVGSPETAPLAETEPVILSEFSVSDRRRHEYQATNSISATRINMPLSEVPFNLQVITSQMIEDTAAFHSAYNQGNGAQRESVSWSGSVDDKRVRGFNTREFLRNGFLRYTDSAAANIERIEIIKGPTAILDGITSPGGVMNVITKQPTPGKDFFKTKLIAGGGRYGRVGSWVDFNGDAGGNQEIGKLITYRVIGSYDRQSNGTRYGEREVTDFAPSLLFRPSERTRVLVEYERWHLNGQRDNELNGRDLLISDVPLAIARDVSPYMSWGGPDETYEERAWDLHLNTEHRFSDSFTGSFALNTNDRPAIYPLDVTGIQVATNPATGQLEIRRQFEIAAPRNRPVFSYRLNGLYKFDVARTSHRLLFGYQYQDEKQNESTYQLFDAGNTTRITQYFPISDPRPNLAGPTNYYARLTAKNYNTAELNSFYLTHQGKFFSNKVATLAGVFYSEVEASASNIAGPISKYSNDKLLPQIGAVYFVTSDVGVYVNYSQSMIPNTRTFDGFDRAFDPTFGESYEIGAKFTLFDGKISGTTSLYQIAEKDRIGFDSLAPNKNTIPGDPNSPRGANVAVGEVESHGFDFDLYYYPITNFSTVLSYGYNQAEITADSVAANVGRAVNSSFDHKVTLWNKYSFSSGAAKGLIVGGGFQWRSKMLRTYRNNLPAYADPTLRLDLMVGYEFKRPEATYRLTLNAKNLTRSRGLPVGFKPGRNDGYYFRSDPELILSLDIQL